MPSVMFPLPSTDSPNTLSFPLSKRSVLFCSFVYSTFCCVLCNELFSFDMSVCHNVQFLETEQCQHFNGHYCSCQCWIDHFYSENIQIYNRFQPKNLSNYATLLLFLFFFIKSKIWPYIDSSSVPFKKPSFIINFTYAWWKKPNTQVKKINCAQSKKNETSSLHFLLHSLVRFCR